MFFFLVFWISGWMVGGFFFLGVSGHGGFFHFSEEDIPQKPNLFLVVVSFFFYFCCFFHEGGKSTSNKSNLMNDTKYQLYQGVFCLALNAFFGGIAFVIVLQSGVQVLTDPVLLSPTLPSLRTRRFQNTARDTRSRAAKCRAQS